jgi:hypothetical protein
MRHLRDLRRTSCSKIISCQGQSGPITLGLSHPPIHAPPTIHVTVNTGPSGGNEVTASPPRRSPLGTITAASVNADKADIPTSLYRSHSLVADGKENTRSDAICYPSVTEILQSVPSTTPGSSSTRPSSRSLLSSSQILCGFMPDWAGTDVKIHTIVEKQLKCLFSNHDHIILFLHVMFTVFSHFECQMKVLRVSVCYGHEVLTFGRLLNQIC